MKHVFVINSHTTFLTSMGTIEYLHLSADDVIFLYVRNYKNTITNINHHIVDATDIANQCQSITYDYENYIHKVDNFAKQFISGKYCIYVPHFWNYFFQILYTNKQCYRASYIQEGGPAQTKVFVYDVPFVERIKSFIKLAILGRRTFECKWYKRGTLYKQRYIDAYATNGNYFRIMHPRTHIVKWPSAKLNFSINAEAPIFILDGHISNGIVEPDIYLKCCEQIVSENAKSYNYIKFHPAQKNEERETILKYFKQHGIKVEVMRDDIPTEYVIIQFKKLTFIGFTSSLLYYAHDNQHNVVCYEKLLTETSPKYKEHVKTCGFQTFSDTYPSL